jgi:hypothetical protein
MRRPYVYIQSTEGKPATSHGYRTGRYVSGRAVRPLPQHAERAARRLDDGAAAKGAQPLHSWTTRGSVEA